MAGGRPATWQKSVLDTLTTFVRRCGLDSGQRAERAQALFAALLAQAKQHRARIASFSPAAAGLASDDWLCVVGLHSRTRIGLKILEARSKVEFEINSDLRVDKWNGNEDGKSVDRAEWFKTGDGTVPCRAALPAFMPLDKIVCVTPDDFGFWELQDKAFGKATGFHGMLPNMNMLIRMIVRYLTGAPDKHANTWGRRAPNLPLEEGWNPPLALEEKKPY